MRLQHLLLASSASSVFAYPGLAPDGNVENMMKREPSPVADPDPLSLPVVSSLAGTISGLLGSVASSVDPANKRPEPGYVFQEPKATDSRGPCPGLNLLANYGYLPRNGLVTFGQVLEASARGFNMGADVAAALSVFAVLTDGDIATESWYIGSGPGSVGGLNRHATVESDISVMREDYYLSCGDNHDVSSRLMKQNVAIVGASESKQFDVFNMGSQYLANSLFSQAYNPYLYYFPFPMIVSLGAFVFYPNLMSNGTYGLGGVANYESISNIIGAKFNSSSGEFEYVPERWPDNWYRRATPYGAVQTVVDGYTQIYPRNPVVPFFSQLNTGKLNATTALCDFYLGINSIVPLFVSGTAEEIAAATTWAISKLDPYFNNTVLGCPSNAISANAFPLYQNPSQAGGPLSPPPAVIANAGNNTYSKTYFTAAPTKPMCSTTSSAKATATGK